MMDKTELNAHINKTDSQLPSPTERANEVWNYLKNSKEDFTDWDLICFSAEFLGLMSVGTLPHLEDAAKEICRLVHTQHYLSTESIPNQKRSSVRLIGDE